MYNSIALMPILLTFSAMSSKYEKDYCFPCQEKILERLKTIYKVDVCRRTLNYNLAWLQANHYIFRTRRIRKGQGGKIVFNTTLYKLTYKASALLANIGAACAGTTKKVWKKAKGLFPVIKKKIYPTIFKSKEEEDEHWRRKRIQSCGADKIPGVEEWEANRSR